LSPYNSIRELQHYASALAKNQTPPARIILSKDIQTISVNGIPIELAKWRGGLKKMYDDTEARIMKVMKGPVIPFSIPDDLQDDMTDLTYGRSWLFGQKFTEEESPLMKRYLDDPEEKLAYYGPDKKLHFHGGRAREVMDDMKYINERLVVLHDTVDSQAFRGTTLTDLRLSNAHRRRNYTRNSGIIRLILQGTKTSNNRGMDSYIPILLCAKMQYLDELYLVLLRPLEEAIAYALWGRESKMLYREFLFVQMGERFTKEMYYKLFPHLFFEYVGVRVGDAQYRHFGVAVMREYMPAHQRLYGNKEYVGDFIGQHSTRQARGGYAGIEGDLPWMTTETTFENDEFCRAWQNITGFGESPPPPPLKFIYNPSLSSEIRPIPACHCGGTAVLPSGEVETGQDTNALLRRMLGKIDSLEETVRQQSQKLDTSLQSLRYNMDQDIQATVAKALAPMYRPGGEQSVPPFPMNVTPISMETSAQSSSKSLDLPRYKKPFNIPYSGTSIDVTNSEWGRDMTESSMSFDMNLAEAEDDRHALGLHPLDIGMALDNPPSLLNADSNNDLEDSYVSLDSSIMEFSEFDQPQSVCSLDIGVALDDNSKSSDYSFIDGPSITSVDQRKSTGGGYIEEFPADLAANEEMALGALRTALGNPDAQWRSDNQRETVMMALSRQEHGISVMKTGEGKSMTWVIPSLLQSLLVSVVVVPYKTLLKQHLQKAQRMGCRAIQWTTSMGVDAIGGNNLIFAAMETAAGAVMTE
jgi:hypothetical protein